MSGRAKKNRGGGAPWRDENGAVVEARRPEPGERVAPHNIDAEQGLLAACLLADTGAGALNEILSYHVTPEYFYRPAHQLMFGALGRLAQRGAPPEEILLANELQDAGQLAAVGGHSYIYELTARIQTGVFAKHWMQIVREKYFLRTLIRTGQWVVEQGHNAADAPADGAKGVVAAVAGAVAVVQGLIIAQTGETGKQVVERVQEKARRDLAGEADEEDRRRWVESGVRNGSGRSELDEKLGLLRPQQFVVYAARPGIGKSSVARQTVREAVAQNLNTAVFTLEVPREHFVRQLGALRAQLDLRQVRERGLRAIVKEGRDADGVSGADKVKIYQEELAWLHDAVDKRLWIFDEDASYFDDIEAKCLTLADKFSGLHLICIDYLQLLNTRDRFDNREQEVADMSRRCKRLARKLDCVVLVLAQLNREAAQERPRLDHLRESGAIEQDADIVRFIHRGKDCNGNNQEPERETFQQLLIQAKGRDDGIGDVWMNFQKRTTTFFGVPPEEHRGRPKGAAGGTGTAPVYPGAKKPEQAELGAAGGLSPKTPGAFQG